MDPLKGRRPKDVREAIAGAAAYAQEKNVPLTAERLAAALGMDLPAFLEVAAGSWMGQTRGERQAAEAIRAAYRESLASVVEHAMLRGNSANMHLLYLKDKAGYGGDGGERQEPVVFMGEEALRD